VIEQPTLSVQAAGVTGERSVRADDAVARDDDPDGVSVVREPHGARGVR
jgi:hypothetical protein